MKQRYWRHPSHKQIFKGTYSFVSGERVLELVGEKTGRVITMESWQMAKSLGWTLSI